MGQFLVDISIQITAVDRVGKNPLVDGFMTDTHKSVIRIITDQAPGGFLRRPVINGFTLNIV